MKKTVIIQFWILLIGTLFAWGNFVFELVSWINKKSCQLGCADPGTNPFLTPCFYGALFFTTSFILSVILVKKIKNNN